MPLEVSFEPGSSMIFMSGSISLAYGWKGFFASVICGPGVSGGSFNWASACRMTISFVVSGVFMSCCRKVFSMKNGFSWSCSICRMALATISVGSSVVATRLRKSKASLFSW